MFRVLAGGLAGLLLLTFATAAAAVGPPVSTYASVSLPRSVAYGPVSGAVYVMSSAVHASGPFKITNNGATVTAMDSSAYGFGGSVLADAAENLYATDASAGGGTVYRYAAGCTLPCTPTIYGSATDANFMALDPAGNLYVTATNFGEVYVLAANCNGACTATLVATGLDEPEGIAIDAAGNLYVTEFNNHDVVKLAAGCTRPCTPTVVASVPTYPAGLRPGADQNLYVTSVGANTISKVTLPGGVVSTFSDDPSLNGPADVAFRPDGTMYIANFLGGAVLITQGPAPVPTLAEAALALFAALMGGLGFWVMRRRRFAGR